MAFPYQRLETFGGVLVAASLSHLDLFSLEDGSRLSSWICLNSSEETGLAGCDEGNGGLPARQIAQQCEPPAKKRRLSKHNAEEEEAVSRVNKLSTRQPATAVGIYEGPTFIALSSTKSGEHVIAVTAEDKTIRVLKHDTRTGKLQQLSQR
jgi:tRNA (guanine-N(7)-)-methyltransferase subunit TRM82